MTLIDLSKTPAISKVQGFGYVDDGTSSLSINSFSLGAGASQSFTDTLAIDVDDATSFTKIKFSGIGNSAANNKWLIFPGRVFIRNTGPAYDIEAVITRSTSGQLLTVRLYNPSMASSTIPDITVSYVSVFFDAPW